MTPAAKTIRVANRLIGDGAACFVIAEAGVNHNGDVALAHQLVDAAATTGADAIKFQTFDASAIASATAPIAEYQRGHGADQREMLARLALSESAHVELQKHARDRGLIFLSSPFDEKSADLLERLDVPAFKIASGEITNHPLLMHVARKRRPLLVSTGMSTLAEVQGALSAISRHGETPFALFHCLSSYPADANHANLRAMATLREAFGRPVGWSDHTPGIEVSIAAAALGAELIEKHLTLDRHLPGPDHLASLEPDAFARLVEGVRTAQSALGDGIKRAYPEEEAIATVARKSLHWRVSLPVGTRVSPEHLVSLRPGTGITPAKMDSLVGRRLGRRVDADTQVAESDLEPRTE